MAKKKHARKGFTLAEILIVVSIFALVQSFLFVSWRGQVNKANDAKRKDDLLKISRAFEDYYNDYNCYPSAAALSNCGATTLSPYLPKVPCDPTTKQPYQYIPLDGDACSGYRVLASLSNSADPDIVRLGCNGPSACGFGAGYNYGVSSGTRVLAPGITPPTATPTPTPGGAAPPTQYACTPQGTCNIYIDPGASGCPVTYGDGTCNNACGNAANRCLQ